MFGEFLTWWARQMRDLIPWRWPGADGHGKRLILAVRTPLEARVLDVELLSPGRRGRSLGVFSLSGIGLHGLRVVMGQARRAADTLTLRLPGTVLLERQVVLPLVAERALQKVLDYEMDRLTPFPADELFWTWAVESRDKTRGEVRLRLSFVSRASLRPLLEALERAGVRPARLEAAIGETRRWIALPTSSSVARRRERWTLALAAGVCAVLAVTAIVLPFVLQAWTRHTVEARHVALSPRVARAEAARRELAARAAGADLFSAERARVGDTMAVLATLTEILPDNTFLTELTLQQRKLGLSGQSGAAARLITALSGTPAIGNPVFSAPVTRVENGRGDVFSIRAEIAP